MAEPEKDALSEEIRVYLRLYTLPANVRSYFAPEDDHDTVAARCAPLLAEHLRGIFPPASIDGGEQHG